MTATHKRSVVLLGIVIVLALALSACSLFGGSATATPTQARLSATATPAAGAAGDGAWARVKASGKLVVGTSADYAPFEFYTKTNVMDGFDIAMTKEIAKRLGVSVEFRDYAFDGLGAALQAKDIDLAVSAITVTPERAAVVDFSNAYYMGMGAVLADTPSTARVNGPRDMADSRVGVQRGSVYETWAQNNLVTPKLIQPRDLFTYGDVDSAIRDLKAKKIDFVLMDQAPAKSYVQAGGVKIVGEGTVPQLYSAAAAKGASSLLIQFNTALDALTANGTMAKLQQQYLGIKPENVTPAPTSTPAPPAPTRAPSAPTSTPAPVACTNSLKFVQDLSMSDNNGTQPPVVQAGTPFTKGWRVRNTGTCTWDKGYSLVYASGNSSMGGQPAFIQGTVAPGADYDMNLKLVAPLTAGTYVGYWQMTDAKNVAFGERLRVSITVPAAPTPVPAPTQTPTTGIIFTANPTTINQGQGTVFNWDVNNAKAVYFFSDGQNWEDNGVAGKDSRTVYPPQSINYYLRVVKLDNSVDTKTIYITVIPAPAQAPVIAQFYLNPPSQINLGQCVVLTWDVKGDVTQVDLLRNNQPVWASAPFSGNAQDCPTTPGTLAYTLKASGPGGSNQSVQYLNVIQPAVPPTATPTPVPAKPTPVPYPVITAFSVKPAQVGVGQCLTLAWTTSGGSIYTRIYRNNQFVVDNGPVVSTGVQDCSTGQPETRVYRLEAVNSAGQFVSNEATVQILAATPK